MLNKIKEKAGNEILQTLVIVAVIGALAITVCMAISGKINQTTADQNKKLGAGLDNAVADASTLKTAK